MQHKTGNPYRVDAVHRALVLLKAMAGQGSLSVTEAADVLEVVPSTAQRILVTLCDDGFAEQGERRRYYPGPEFLRPGIARSTPPLRVRVRPHLERLFDAVNETVHLAVLVGTEIDHLDGIETSQSLRIGSRIGVRLPAHRTSAGKAMLAALSTPALDALYRNPAHDHHQVDLSELHRIVDETRRRHLGVNRQESEVGVTAFGGSIGVIGGRYAALSIAMPSARFAEVDGEAISATLLTICEDAQRDLAADAEPMLTGPRG